MLLIERASCEYNKGVRLDKFTLAFSSLSLTEVLSSISLDEPPQRILSSGLANSTN